MKHFIKFTALLTAVILLLGTVGCKDSYQNAIIYYEVPERPFTLDAQTASTDSELSIVKKYLRGAASEKFKRCRCLRRGGKL